MSKLSLTVPPPCENESAPAPCDRPGARPPRLERDEMPKRSPAPDRFWAKVAERGPDECWLWTASQNGAGYGKFGAVSGASPVYAHRFAYELVVGPIPDGLTIDHLCGVKLCVNPAHLEPVTQAVNTRRAGNAVKTRCPQGHPYDEANTYVYASGAGRHCRACDRERKRERKAAA